MTNPLNQPVTTSIRREALEAAMRFGYKSADATILHAEKLANWIASGDMPNKEGDDK